MEKYEIVSFIPARGGSERLPRKNIKMLAGKPMLAWTIEASLQSKYIDRTIVSTEDAEIKEVALKYGAEVIDRPAKYSTKRMLLNFVYFHFQYCLWKENYQPDYTIFLLPTMPLRSAKHIDEAFELYFRSESPLLKSVTKVHYRPIHTDSIDESGELKPIFKESVMRVFNKMFFKDDAIMPTIYYTDNSICIGPYKGVNDLTFQYIGGGVPYIMEAQDTIDVDTPLDFKVAEMLMKERIKREGG